MKLVNLEKVQELLDYNEYESYELVSFTNQDGFVDASEFYELNNLKELKTVCKEIIQREKNLEHIELKLILEDSDFDMIVIYKK
jgi:hypothetical protein